MSLLTYKLKIPFPITTDLRHWLPIGSMGHSWERTHSAHYNTPGQLFLFCTSLQHPVDISISFKPVAHLFLTFSFSLASRVHMVAVESLATSHWKANLFVCLCQVIWFTVPASIASSQDCLLRAAAAQMGQALITHSFILLTDGQQAEIRWWRVSVGWGT